MALPITSKVVQGRCLSVLYLYYILITCLIQLIFYVCIKLFADAVKLLTNRTLPSDVKNVALQEHLDMLAMNRVQC